MGTIVAFQRRESAPVGTKNPVNRREIEGMRRTTFDDVSRFLFDPNVPHCERQRLLNSWRKTWGLEALA